MDISQECFFFWGGGLNNVKLLSTKICVLKASLFYRKFFWSDGSNWPKIPMKE